MKSTDKTQAKQGRGQKKLKVQAEIAKKSVEKRQPPAMTIQASEEKFRRLFETAQDGILLLDAETGAISEANPFIEELLGYSRAELIGKKLWEIGPFKDITASQDAFLVLQKKRHIRYEDLPLETKDGRRRNVEFVSNVYRVGSQKVIQCNIRDITERRQAESALAESERRYRVLFDNAGLGVFQSAVDGRVIAVNPEFARMFGYKSPEEFISLVKNVADVFADPQRREEIIRLKAETPDLTRFESLYRRKDSSTFLGNLTLRQATGPEGHELFFEGLIEDITERKEADAAFRENEEKYRLLFENMAEGAFYQRDDGVLVDVNQSALEMLGLTRDQFLMRTSYHPEWKIIREDGVVLDSEQHPSMIALRTGKMVRDVVVGIYNPKKRNYTWVRINAIPQFKPDEDKPYQVFVTLHDITERRRADEALRHSEAFLDSIIEYSPHAMWISDDKGTLIRLNQACRDLLHIKDEEVVGKYNVLQDNIVKEQGHLPLVRRVFEKGETVNFGLRYDSSQLKQLELEEKTSVILDVTISPVFDAKGKVTNAIIQHVDVTERRRAEDALRESEERYRLLFELSPDAIAVHRGGKIIFANHTAAKLVGADSPEELIGRPVIDFVHPDYREMAMARIRQLAEGRPVPSIDEKYIRLDGSILNVENLATPIRYQDDMAFLVIVRDITERKRAENELRALSTRQEAILAAVPDILMEVNKDKVYTWANQAGVEFFGEDVIGKEAAFYFEGEQDTYGVVKPLFNGSEDVVYVESWQRRKDGEKRLLAWWCRVLKDTDGNATGALSSAHDITERKEVETALQKERDLAQQYLDMAGVLIAALNADGKITLLNHRGCEILGYEENELIGCDWVGVCLPVDVREEVRGVLERLIADDIDSVEYHENAVLTKSGAQRILAFHNTVIRDQASRIIGILFSGEDITERKHAEEQIRFLSRFPDENPYPVLRIAPGGILLYANKASAPLLALWRTGVGQNMPDDWLTWIKEIIKSGHNKEVEINCGKRLFSCILTPVVDAGYVNVYGRDITKRKKVEKALARQTEELHRRNDELARLYRASGSLLSGASLSLQELAQMIVGVVQQEFGQANCSLLVIHRDSNELQRLAVAGPYTDQVMSKTLTLDGPGLVPKAIRAGMTLNVGNVRSTPDYLPNWEAAQSELAIPLKIGNNVIGAIDIQSSEPEAFSPDDERLMSIFAERAALALEHSRLNAQTDSRMQQLIALRAVDMAISGSFDINLTLGVLLDQVTGQLGVHAADILIFNAAAQTFEFSCERGFRTQTLRHTRLKFGAGYAWRLVRERQVINIPDIKKGPDGLQRSPDLSGEQFVAYVGIPLIAKGQIKGVLEIFHREPVKFDPEWYRFLELLAGQAAIAIDNAELFDNLQSSNSELSMAYDSTLEGWASALELRDHETEGHTRRATELTTRLAQAMGIKENDMVHIYRGALLHDIGKMGVPDSIVLKPGPLTEDEWLTMRKHSQYAYDMLSPISYLRLALDIPYCHHEKWDGTGYPRGLKGEQIPVAARIFAVVDVWDALTSDRPYRKAWTHEQAKEYIYEQAGKHFDPKVVEIFLREVKYD